MTESQACRDLISSFEGLCLEAYWDATGKCWTIGRGHTGDDVHEGDVITERQADLLFALDVARCAKAVTAAVEAPMTQGQFDALVSFAFNCRHWETSSLIRLANAGLMEEAAAEFPKWIHSGGKVLGGLVRRRAAERQLFES